MDKLVKYSEYFNKPDTLFFNEYPESSRNDWQIRKWTQTPCKESDMDAYHFASSTSYDLDFKIKELMNEEGNYYSYECKMNGDIDYEWIGNIHFYIISPKRELIVKVLFYT
ncbi:MAG: hypothetical protein ACI85O_001932 [Saprospiraceae bacterium]|jgi:hypothetical protein